MKTRIIYLFFFCLLSRNLFCQNDSLPNKMISFTSGLNFNYASVQDYNVNESLVFDMPPPPNTLTKIEGQVTTHNNLNFYENLSFAKRIIHYNHNSIFLTAGLTYKYLITELTYYTREYRSPANYVSGNGKTVWKEHYLSPTLGISLYSNISKKIYLENNISFDYNYILSGKESVDYTGSQNNVGQNNVSSYEKHEIIVYSKKRKLGNTQQFIAHQFDAYYKLAVNYLYHNVMIGAQFALPLPSLRDRKTTSNLANQENPSSLLYDKNFYHQIAFELSLKLFLK